MPRFFIQTDQQYEVGSCIFIEGQDALHIEKSLRMAVGDSLVLCDGKGLDYQTVIEKFDNKMVVTKVTAVEKNKTEPSVFVTLYQGLPKGDKMETILQKCVELGASKVIPVEMSRCIAKMGDKAEKRIQRWQKIADEAAGQSGRGILPQVGEPISFSKLLENIRDEKTLVCYENGGLPLGEQVGSNDKNISIIIGPEGGISEEEIEKIKAVGGTVVTMGPRILRTETAPIAAIAVIMEKTGNWN